MHTFHKIPESTIIIESFWDNLVHNLFILISSFFEIDFEIKTNAKKSRRFDLSEVIFKWVKFFKLA